MNNDPVTHRVSVNNIEICLHEWNPQAKATTDTILLLHATGFHGRCWDEIVANLGDHHVLAWDMRGHGKSEKAAPCDFWNLFHSDLEGIIDALVLKDVICVGHSIGGWCAAMASATRPNAFRRLVLLDPVIMSPEHYEQAKQQKAARANSDHPVKKRRNNWNSWQEMYKRFQDRAPFNRWSTATLKAYCQYGLTPDPAGSGYVLACPPDVEASVYLGSINADIHKHIADIQVPAKVLRVTPRGENREITDFSSSPTWPLLAEKLPQGQDIFLPELTHFIPMEAPEITTNYILDEG